MQIHYIQYVALFSRIRTNDLYSNIAHLSIKQVTNYCFFLEFKAWSQRVTFTIPIVLIEKIYSFT